MQGFQGAEDLFEELNGVFGGRNARSKGAGRDVNISVPVIYTIYIHLCTYVRMYIRMYGCIYIYVCTYIHIIHIYKHIRRSGVFYGRGEGDYQNGASSDAWNLHFL